MLITRMLAYPNADYPDVDYPDFDYPETDGFMGWPDICLISKPGTLYLDNQFTPFTHSLIIILIVAFLSKF